MHYPVYAGLTEIGGLGGCGRVLFARILLCKISEIQKALNVAHGATDPS